MGNINFIYFLSRFLDIDDLELLKTTFAIVDLFSFFQTQICTLAMHQIRISLKSIYFYKSYIAFNISDSSIFSCNPEFSASKLENFDS